MNDIIKWILKVTFQGVLWVFLLSISVSGRPIFEHAHSTLVQNAFVAAVDEELTDLWEKLSRTAQVTFSTPSEEDKAM